MKKIPYKQWVTIYELEKSGEDDQNSQLSKSMLLAWFKENYNWISFNINCSKEQLNIKTLEYESYIITTPLKNFHHPENTNLKKEWNKYYEKYTSNCRTMG